MSGAILRGTYKRWAPVHGLVALSQARDITEAVQTVFARRESALHDQGIRTGFLFNSVAGSCIAIEPLFFWPDSLDEIHATSVEPDFYRRVPKLETNPAARQLVTEIRQELIDLFSARGASHLQIGRSYHYQGALMAPAGNLIKDIKQALDPDNLINPGALGLG